MVADKRYIAGSFYRRDDRSGRKVRSFDMLKEWNGLWIKASESEPRQTQDFVRGEVDDQRVEEPRPTPTPGILGPLTTTLTAAAAAGATTLLVESSVRMSTGDIVEVLVGDADGAFQFRTTLLSVPTATSLQLTIGLPRAAVSGALVTDITANAIVLVSDL